MPDNYYDLLEVAPDAGAQAIKSAYRRKVRLHHPDRGGDADTMQQLATAYRVLSNEAHREEYDRSLREPPTSGESLDGHDTEPFVEEWGTVSYESVTDEHPWEEARPNPRNAPPAGPINPFPWEAGYQPPPAPPPPRWGDNPRRCKGAFSKTPASLVFFGLLTVVSLLPILLVGVSVLVGSESASEMIFLALLLAPGAALSWRLARRRARPGPAASYWCFLVALFLLTLYCVTTEPIVGVYVVLWSLLYVATVETSRT